MAVSRSNEDSDKQPIRTGPNEGPKLISASINFGGYIFSAPDGPFKSYAFR
jgi:hypothetical protein